MIKGGTVIQRRLTNDQAQLFESEKRRKNCSQSHVTRQAINIYFTRKTDVEQRIVSAVSRIQKTLKILNKRLILLDEILGCFIKLRKSLPSLLSRSILTHLLHEKGHAYDE